MADLIDRTAALERFRAENYERSMIAIVREAPTVDAVEVVRCKDCKCSGMYSFCCGEEENLPCLEIEDDGFVRFATAVEPDDFCSYGERKEK